MELPLFPLPNLVLFPNVIVPLHIFEDRYRLMINGCIDHNEMFGLVLLREGEGETAEMIHRVGVAARVIEAERLNDGRMNILAQGETRFRVRRFLQSTPFWKGDVDLFEDEAATFPESDIYESVTVLYRKVFELSSKLSPPQGQELVLPESPADLSFVVSYILEIDAEEKQDLLEMTSTAQRMKTLVTHLGDTVRKLEQQIVYKEAMTKARGNGHLRKPH